MQLDAQAYGLTLFDALFAGPIRDAYLLAVGRAAERSEGQLRVRLWLDNAAVELHHQIAWERLYDTHTGRPLPMAASAKGGVWTGFVAGLDCGVASGFYFVFAAEFEVQEFV